MGSLIRPTPRPCNLCGRVVRMGPYERFCGACKKRASALERERAYRAKLWHPDLQRSWLDRCGVPEVLEGFLAR